MRLSQIIKVLEAERAGSISKAAEQLGVAQSALSRTIGELEKELGITIFVRTAKGIFLTEAGREAIRLMRSVMANVDNILMIAGEQRQLQGELTAALPPSVYNALAAELVKEFQQTYPLAALRLLEMDANSAVKAVSGGKCDLGVGLFMPNEQDRYLSLADEMSVACTLLVRVRFKLYMSAKNPLAQQQEIALAQLADAPMLEFLSAGLEKIVKQPQAAHQVSHRLYNRETLKKLISLDYGMAFMPEFMEWQDYYVQSGLITGRYVSDYPEMLNCYLLYSHLSMMSPLEKAFVMILTRRLEELVKGEEER